MHLEVGLGEVVINCTGRPEPLGYWSAGETASRHPSRHPSITRSPKACARRKSRYPLVRVACSAVIGVDVLMKFSPAMNMKEVCSTMIAKSMIHPRAWRPASSTARSAEQCPRHSSNQITGQPTPSRDFSLLAVDRPCQAQPRTPNVKHSTSDHVLFWENKDIRATVGRALPHDYALLGRRIGSTEPYSNHDRFITSCAGHLATGRTTWARTSCSRPLARIVDAIGARRHRRAADDGMRGSSLGLGRKELR